MGDKPSKESQKNLEQKLEAAEKKVQEMNDDKRKQEVIWRRDNLGAWDNDVKTRLLKDIITETQSMGSISGETSKYLRIIFVGAVGSGKSTLINSFNGALRGRVDNRALEGGRDHTTKQFLEYEAYDPHGNLLNFTFCDVRGLGKTAAGSTEVDILRAILGKKKVGEVFTPDKTYEDALEEDVVDEKSANIIIYVIDAGSYCSRTEAGEADPCLPQLLNLKDKTDGWRVGRCLILTHMDSIDPELAESVKGIHQSNKVKKVFEDLVNETKFPKRCVFPVSNPVEFVQEIPDDFCIHLLYTLLSVIRDAVDMLKHRSFHNSRLVTQSD